ncbi:beta-galactosidase [Streptomyces sp. NPDC046712]|uniref:beta-galactosidase n=1 Tax=Streptomyces sp. NPDC046712 TaxID=3154802 RepID=UPI0033F47795
MTPVRRDAVRRAIGRVVDHAARHRRHVGILAAVLLVVACVQVPQAQEAGGSHYYFGTLQTMPDKARLERSKGLEVAHLQIEWDEYEPREGEFSQRYLDSVRRELDDFQEAGMLIEASLGLNHPPDWLFDDYEDTAYVNQYGDSLTETPNMVFSQTVREKAQRYVDRVARDIGLENFWAIRVVVSGSGEFTYPTGGPDRDDGEEKVYYWAYDDNAQSPSGAGRPATIPDNPYPGWEPGERDYRGKEFTEQQVREWYAWYLRALADAVNWQVDHYMSLRYDGFMKVLVPGSGYYPRTFERVVDQHLDPAADNARLVALGVGFFMTLGHIDKHPNVEIVSTSLVDGTGDPENNGCAATDGEVNVLDPPPHIQGEWSSMRWISNIARQYGFRLLNGESAGTHVSDYYPGVMDDAAHQMKSCGLRGLMWAFDSNLYDDTPGSSLADYAAVISRYN